MEDLQQILHVYLSQCDMQPIFGRDREKSFLSGREDLRPRGGFPMSPHSTLCFSLCLPSVSPTLFLNFISRQFVSKAFSLPLLLGFSVLVLGDIKGCFDSLVPTCLLT